MGMAAPSLVEGPNLQTVVATKAQLVGKEGNCLHCVSQATTAKYFWQMRVGLLFICYQVLLHVVISSWPFYQFAATWPPYG